ncbi:hypothetical protein AAFF_G00267740 [Aldrovandia affinis]|uniref:Uncharacterized protein n=1 Tax=Aldrovandia affinis TaxID=143900 RepID=A0AAD7WSU3_9TELE|nr:hypothetical protein AAFF_G00267740 [Aldrovandia affinis]
MAVCAADRRARVYSRAADPTPVAAASEHRGAHSPLDKGREDALELGEPTSAQRAQASVHSYRTALETPPARFPTAAARSAPGERLQICKVAHGGGERVPRHFCGSPSGRRRERCCRPCFSDSLDETR